jgi:hypothetical protein
VFYRSNIKSYRYSQHSGKEKINKWQGLNKKSKDENFKSEKFQQEINTMSTLLVP